MTAPALAPQTLVHGRYQVVRLLGQGGMGAVYEAIDNRLGNRVALKQLLMRGGQLDLAFEREAKLLAGLRHPALPAVSDFFTEALGQFLVMQFIPGDDLAALLARRGGPFPVADVLGWADQMLKVLAYLHRQRPPVIHRDIKPQNLKLTSDGEIVLLDFGLAKGATMLQSGTTSGRSFFGYTPQYAPLEQIQGSGTDERSDLYAMAATLYHLLTGVLPADALTRAAAMMTQQPDPLHPAHTIMPHVPPPISAALGQALAMHPDSRPASAVELRAALIAPQQTAAVHAPQPPLAPTLVAPPQAPNTASTIAVTPPPKLSPREREVLALVVGGYSDERIAQQLSIRTATVKDHLANIQRKAGVWMRPDLINWAIAQGVRPPAEPPKPPPKPPPTDPLKPSAPPDLAEGGRAVLALMVSGYSDQQIAQKLSIHLKMVYGQIDYLESKARVVGRENLINWAKAQGVELSPVEPPPAQPQPVQKTSGDAVGILGCLGFVIILLGSAYLTARLLLLVFPASAFAQLGSTPRALLSLAWLAVSVGIAWFVWSKLAEIFERRR